MKRIKVAEPIVEPVKIMLDSGAYSAWYHGAPLDLDHYISYAGEHQKLFDAIVGLDQIPGANRSAAKTSGDIERAAVKSYENFHRMRKAGLEVIPVFHQGEDWSWLDRYLFDGVPYVGISPYPRAGQDSILHWLDEVFTRITDEAGEPLIKTHGFGATSWGMITRYPWFSIDSTTWALAAGYGTIILPPFTHSPAHGVLPTYDRPPFRFSISDRDTAGSRPFHKQGKWTKSAIGQFIESAGLSLSQVANSDRYRAELNAYYYVQLEKSLEVRPFRYRKHGDPTAPMHKRLVRFNFKPRVIFAEQIGKHEYGRALARVGASNRLISYYECRRYPTSDLAIYAASGLLPKIGMAAKKRGSQSWTVNRRLGLLKRLKETEDD
jgi:hypothetical protein